MKNWTTARIDVRRAVAGLAAAIALTLLIGVLTPTGRAAAQPVAPPPSTTRVDVRDPGAAGATLRHPFSRTLYRVVEIAPGIGVTDRVTPESNEWPAQDGTRLPDDRFQLLADRIAGVLDLVRRTPTGAATLEAIPHLLAPTASMVWTVPRPDGSEGERSRLQIVFAEGAGRAESAIHMKPFGETLSGAGSLVTLGQATWEDADSISHAWFDLRTGGARILTPEATVQHELAHAVADLAGGAPKGSVLVPVPASRAWPITGPLDYTTTVSIDTPYTEVFTQGGPRGLTAARAALTTPGPKGEAPIFTTDEFPSIGVDPWLLRAQRHAADRFLAAETPAADRQAWLSAAAARLSVAMQPPTETTFARERGVRGRTEYYASAFFAEGRFWTSLPVAVPAGSDAWTSDDLRGSSDVLPVDGSWQSPRVVDRPVEATASVPSAPDPAGEAAVPRAARPEPSCASCLRSAAASSALSAEEAAAFEARVASEAESAFEGPRAVQRRVLADPVGDAVRQVRGPGLASGVWARYPKLVAGLQNAPVRVLAGTDGVGFAGLGLGVSGLLNGDTSALSITNTTTDVLTTVAPMLGVRIANTIGAAGAVVGFITSTIAFTQGGSETDYIFSMVGLLTALVPELAPLMVIYLVASLVSQPTPLEESMDAGQQMAVAFEDWAVPALEKQGKAMADAMIDATSDRMAEARYRADYLQTKVDLEQLAEGHDLTTGGGDGGSQEQKRVIREATDQELARISWAGSASLDQGLDALLEDYNSGAVFLEFREKWAETMNEDGGVSIHGSKHHVDLDELPTTNPTPVHVDEFTTPLGSIRTIMQSRYRHALEALPLWTPSRNAFATPMVTEETVLASVPTVQRDWAFTGPLTTATEPVDGVTAFTGTGTPGSFVQVWSTTSNDLVCGATKVNTIGLWTCRSEKGFQSPGTSAAYELHASGVDTGGFASVGRTVTVTTTAKPAPPPVVKWGPELRVEGRTVIGTVTPGAVVQLQTMAQDSTDASRNGAPVSDPVTATDGRFTLTARPDTPGGSTRLVATLAGTAISERIVLDGGPTVPARIPESVEGSSVRILHVTATSIEGVVPAGQKVQLRLGEDPALLPVETDATGAFRIAFDRPLPNPQTIILRSWPADRPWEQSTRTVEWAGHDQ